jgi:hypothetical protein
MRAIDFLREYENIDSAKQEIIQTLAGFDANDEQHAQILDRIWKLLHSENFSGNIENSFKVTTADEVLSAKNLERHRRAVAQIISGLDSDYAAMNNFIKKLETGGVINIDELSKPVSSFNAVFDGDAVALKAFDALKSYGVGENQKGPGEFALAMLSNKIRLAAGAGDTEIQGIGKVEVKAAVGGRGQGGRLGHGGASQEQQTRTLLKFQNDIPMLVNSIQSQPGGSIGLRAFVNALNVELPISDSKNSSTREAIAKGLLTPNFGEYANKIAAAFRRDDVENIIETYVKQNFEWYKAQDNFDAYLIISFARQKMGMGRTGEDIIKMRKAGQLTDFAISIIPSKAGPREQFAQISLSAGGI